MHVRLAWKVGHHMELGHLLDKMATNSYSEDNTQRLFDAVANYDIKTVEYILKQQPELVNVRAETKIGFLTPLLAACYQGTLHTVQILLKAGADINKTGHVHECQRFSPSGQALYPPVQRCRGGYGASDDVFPLFIAARRTTVPLVEEILFAGASVNGTNSIGQSALHVASMNFDGSSLFPFLVIRDDRDEHALNIVRNLIESGADVNLRDKNGRTPLHYACEHGHRYLVKILLEKRADINVKDLHGLTALELASQKDHDLMKAIIDRCNLPKSDIIEAYEIGALLHYNPYQTLHFAAKKRLTDDVPKSILEPLECYRNVGEWKTHTEVHTNKNDQMQLRLQSILARERIFKGRYVNFMKEEMLQGILQTQADHLNVVLKHQLDLFKENNDYLYFADVFVTHDSVLNRLFKFIPGTLIQDESIVCVVEVALESCSKMQEALNTETRLGVIRELISQLEITLVAVGVFVLVLLSRKRETDDDAQQVDCDLATMIFKKLWDTFPVVTCPATSYKCPLPHVLFSDKHKALMFTYVLTPHHLKYQYELVKMIVRAGFNINETDSHGNTLLHVVVSSLPNDNKWFIISESPSRESSICEQTTVNIVKHLLDNGVYLHAKNKMRKTAMELIRDSPCLGFMADHITDEMKEYDCFPTLQQITATKLIMSRIPYRDTLPETLVQFVDLH